MKIKRLVKFYFKIFSHCGYNAKNFLGGILFSAEPSITGKLMLGGGESGHQLTALSPLHNGASRQIQWISMCADAASGYHHCSGSLLCWLQCGQCSVWLA